MRIATFGMNYFSRSVFVCAFIFCGFVRAADTVQFTDAASGLLSWKATENGFSLQLIQLQPDYVSAVYASRGLPQKLIDGVLKYCVFGTIVKNESDQLVSYRVMDWHYFTSDGKKNRVKTKSEWLKDWEAMGVGYRWSILPDDQTFSPGDWSQGFTTISVRPDEGFDFSYKWTFNGKVFENTIKGIRCASNNVSK